VTRDQFLQLAAEYQLGHIANEILSTAIPSVRVLRTALRAARTEDQTFLGGMPRPMPKDWPQHRDLPLTFVAQVAMASVPPDICPVPQPDGILQFFVPPVPENHDYEPSLDCGRVIFVDLVAAKSESTNDESSEGPAPKPSLVSRVFSRFKVEPYAKPEGNSMPSQKIFSRRTFEWEVFPSLYPGAPDPDGLWLPDTARSFNFNFEADEENYFDFRRAVLAKSHCSLCAQMFGFADPLQEDMEPIVNTFAGNPSSEIFRDWLLLFALNSSCAGLAPEAACYYFWIHRDDLADCRFDNVWLCVQRD
jgi:uncharacterized protein YwqG